jgi:hypothetical protein
MTSKENNTLSASLLRNQAYSNQVGTFTSNELYCPETVTSDDEACMSSDGNSFQSSNRDTETPSNPMHDSDTSNNSTIGYIIPPNDSIDEAVHEKKNIKKQLENLFKRST